MFLHNYYVYLWQLLVLYDDGTYSFTLPAIPYLRIPVNGSDCKANKPTTHPHQDISTTPNPNDKRECTHTHIHTICHKEQFSISIPLTSPVTYLHNILENAIDYQTTILAIEIGVPSVLVFIFVVCCSLALLYKCVKKSMNRTNHYSLLKITSDLESDDKLEDDQNNYFT